MLGKLLPDFIEWAKSIGVTGLIASAAIVVLGLFVYGLKDLLRSRPGRVWAISGVCFRDAIRRRVLWITPLAMLGIVLIGQFQKNDEPDTVRATIKICLFTTGLVVTIISLVTAATNLPREIDNRVIFTIVTKPITRLEIVLGKIVGFARVSAVMLLVMGVFSLVYLHGQSWWLGRSIAQQLDNGSTEGSRRIWLEHFRDEGLLQSRSLVQSDTMMQYARPPESEDGGYIAGGMQDAIVRIPLEPKSLESARLPDAPGGSAGILLAIKIGYEPVHAPPAGTTQPAAAPSVTAQIIDLAGGSVIMSAEQLAKNSTVTLADPAGEQSVYIQVTPERATQLAQLPVLDIQLICSNPEFLYHIRNDAVTVIVPDSDTNGHAVKSKSNPLLRGSSGRGGQQLYGPGRGVRPVAIYAFRDTPVPATISGNRVPFELNVNVDATGDTSEREPVGTIEVRAKDRKSGKVSEPVVVYPESRRTVFFEMPDDFVKSGDFDLQVQNSSSSHTVGVTRASLSMVAGREYFGFNLFKALVVIWLLSVLAATVAFWCSTFLSWPIAVVLSTLIILGHWAVSNVDLGSGIGAAVANDMVGGNAPVARVVNTSVENLSRALVLVSGVLPDITSFGVTDRIEKGTSLTVADMAAPLGVLTLFGLPLITVAYVFLRNKEVAP